MKFLFINPPMDYDTVKEIFSFESFLPPLGLLYLGRVLEELGHTVEIRDFCAEAFTKEKLIQALQGVDAVGITICSHILKSATMVAQTIKDHDPHMPIVIGGPHCAIQEQAISEVGADIAVEGEGELIIADIADAIQGKKKLDDIPGIFYKENGSVKHGPPARLIENLDVLPFPARHLIANYSYGYRPGIPFLMKGHMTSIITSRGCPFNCTFCISKAIAKTYRLRSAKNVVAEMAEIAKDYESLIIIDDNFLANKKRANEIMDLLIKEHVDLELWVVGTRIDDADKALFRKMKRAGVQSLEFGIESGNQDVLDYYQKKITLEEIKKTVKLSRKNGFFTVGNFIFGAPMETKKHFENTIKFAKKLPLDYVYFAPLMYLKGSELWDRAVKEGKIRPEESYVKSDVTRGLGSFTKQELEQWCIKAHKAFYLNPKYITDQFIQQLFVRGNFRLFKAGLHLFLGEEENILTQKVKPQS